MLGCLVEDIRFGSRISSRATQKRAHTGSGAITSATLWRMRSSRTRLFSFCWRGTKSGNKERRKADTQQVVLRGGTCIGTFASGDPVKKKKKKSAGEVEREKKRAKQKAVSRGVGPNGVSIARRRAKALITPGSFICTRKEGKARACRPRRPLKRGGGLFDFVPAFRFTSFPRVRKPRLFSFPFSLFFLPLWANGCA